MTDTKFNDAIKELRAIHKLAPTLKFGQIIQLSIDYHKNKINTNLTQISTKSYCEGLKKFKKKIKGGKL